MLTITLTPKQRCYIRLIFILFLQNASVILSFKEKNPRMAYRRIGYVECKDYVALGRNEEVCGSGQAILAQDIHGTYSLDTEVIYVVFPLCF